MNPIKVCSTCGVELTALNWTPSNQRQRRNTCTSCYNTKQRIYDHAWRHKDPEKARLKSERGNRKRGLRPFNENKECAAFLGVYVAERVLKHVFKNVKQMPYGNVGFDYICGRGYKIDVKSGCVRHYISTRSKHWAFNIDYNEIADYFLCIAFDDRENLNPMHLWLIPSADVNNQRIISISESTLQKWNQYKLDIAKVIRCCDVLKENPNQ